MALTVLTGGARSGKSALAVRVAARWGGGVSLVVTGEPRDDEMRARIERHRADRPSTWRVIEEPLDLTDAISAVSDEDLVVVDCLTLWVSNLLEIGVEPDGVAARAGEAAKTAAARPGPTLVVTNEVGSGIVPLHPATRGYRDVMGIVNATFAREARRALLVVAGRAIPLAGVEEVLDDVTRG